MKYLRSGIVLFLLLTMPLFAKDSLRVVTTYGRIKLNVPADYATLSFKVVTNGPSLRKAFDTAQMKVGSVTRNGSNLDYRKKYIDIKVTYRGEL